MLTLGLLDMDATLLDGAVRCTMGFLALAVEGIDMLAAAEGIIVAGFMLVAEGMLMLAAGFMLAAAEGIIVEGIDMLDAGFMYSFSCCLGANMVNRKKMIIRPTTTWGSVISPFLNLSIYSKYTKSFFQTLL